MRPVGIFVVAVVIRWLLVVDQTEDPNRLWDEKQLCKYKDDTNTNELCLQKVRAVQRPPSRSGSKWTASYRSFV